MNMSKSFISLFCLISFFSINTIQSAQSIYTQLAEYNLRAFPTEEEEEYEGNSMAEWVSYSLEKQMNPPPKLKRRHTLSILATINKHAENLPNEMVLDAMTWEDLNLFCGKQARGNYLAHAIDCTHTELGSVTLLAMLAKPSVDITILKQRQAIIDFFLKHDDIRIQLQELLDELAKNESIMLSLWCQDPIKQAAQRGYFKAPLLKVLNNNEHMLELNHLRQHWQRATWICANAAATVLLPVFGFSLLSNIPLPSRIKSLAQDCGSEPLFAFLNQLIQDQRVQGITKIVSGVYCASAAKESFDWEMEHVVLERCVQTKLIAIARYCAGIKKISALLKQHNVLCALFPALEKIEHVTEDSLEQPASIRTLFALFDTATFKGDASILSHMGRVFRAYALMYESKKYFERILPILGELDVYLAMAELYKKFEQEKVAYSFAQYVDGPTPLIALVDFWNPLVDPDNVVTNTITLGGDQRSNIVITGPNAGGKSTILKAIAMNLILAQTFGIAPARNVTITPFDKIITYLNITDDIAAGQSLFKAEVVRAHEVLKTITALKPGQVSFTAMDEIFNGTTPIEGQAAAFSVAKHLGMLDHNICAIATHFARVTELEEKTTTFANYKVSVNRHDDGSISYPFLLQPGIADQHVAIDMLRIEGFTNKILDDAAAMIAQS